MTKITLAVTGSIAAYKAADLTSLLTKEGHDVTVLMTKSATQFITPLTLQVLSKNKVHLDIMDEERPELVNHIDLAKNSKSVKKTLTIPAWLNDRALAKGINFSQLLQEALVEKTM